MLYIAFLATKFTIYSDFSTKFTILRMVRSWIFKVLMMISRPSNGWKGLKRAGKVDFPSENGASRTTYVSRPTTAG